MSKPNHISGFKLGSIIAGMFGVVFVIILLFGGLGKNDVQNFQVIQSITGKVSIRDKAGIYPRWFASVWTYPKAVQREFKRSGRGNLESKANRKEDQSISITFNDGGKATIDCMIRYATPTTAKQRRMLHETFQSIDGVTQAVRSHLINCAKATAPLMSSTDHMSARKAEFTQLVNAQLTDGLYTYRRVHRVWQDQTENGKEIAILATEIVRDEKGVPIIDQESPLKQYGLVVTQFSIEDTIYDAQTLKQFAAKKESLLEAEKSKAEREQEVQRRLMVVERGLREKAEITALANKEKARAVINAQREKEVAEVNAAKQVAVAKQEKLEAETRAAQLVAVAKLNLEQETYIRQAAEQKAKAIRILAQAEEERIKKGGAITEEKLRLAEIQAQRDVDVAAKLAQIKVPSTMIIGGGNGTGNGHVMENLINMALLRANGITVNEMPSTAAVNTSR